MKTEQEIFNEIETLSRQDGFWEIIAFFCWKDTYIHFSGDTLNAEVFAQQFDKSRLSRTELSTLIGIACKSGFKAKKLEVDELKERTEYLWQLLEELHSSMSPRQDIAHLLAKYNPQNNIPPPDFSTFMRELSPCNGLNPMMREAIFYGGNCTFKHQYRDLAKRRYSYDDEWIQENKGFNISQAATVISAIEKIQLDKVNQLISSTKSGPLSYHLPAFIFDINELIKESNLHEMIVKAVISAFSASPKEGMDCFKSIDDFNHRNAFPIIKIEEGRFATFQTYSLWETLYESPFFWFNSDKKYKALASQNRGAFTEAFTAERLSLVFGKEHVLTNIDIFNGKNKAGEIDVLVTFGKFALVVQAKSKKLTIEARKGNSKQLESDFKSAIQDANNQAFLCSTLLQSEECIFKDAAGIEVNISSHFKVILPVCILSDHFPALSAQTRHFLKSKTTDVIKHPYVMDVFLIDMITEVLPSPLWLLDYLMKRNDCGHSILAHHELITLSSYIKESLYFDKKPDIVMLEEDISGDLELAMRARRDAFDADKTPGGVLTSHKNTHIGKIIKDVEHSTDYACQKLGFHLLSMSADRTNLVNDAISKMIIQFKKDGRHHDITLPFLDEKTGLIVHCNEDDNETAYKKLVMHCEKRKYHFKANSWIGCCYSPVQGMFRFSIYHESKWCQSDVMDELVSDLKPLLPKHNIKNIKKLNFGQPAPTVKNKMGRNDPCPCGSGKKYKRCCFS